MNYFISDSAKRKKPQPRIVACRLDSKARLVLPLVVREKLSLDKGEAVLFEIMFSGSQAFLKASKGKEAGLKRMSKNGWET